MAQINFMKNASLETMRQIKLTGMADAYEGLLNLPVNQQPAAHEMLARLVDAEKQHRSQWHEYFDEPTIADAILDRIIPKAHRIDLKGKSLRKQSKHVS